MSDKEGRPSGEIEELGKESLPEPITQSQPKPKVHAALYIAVWIALSSSVIIFNKWILDRKHFRFPILLTTWHLIFATVMTQLMSRFTTLLDSRHKVPMTGRVYLRAIVPIGVVFSASLMFSNMTYLYLSVSFIQMLKATTPVATLFASWILKTREPSMKTLVNISAIVVGVIIASFGELKFEFVGFVLCMLGVMCEATRLAMVERLLSSAEFKMDPMVSLYYFAPVCALMNGVVGLLLEGSNLTMDQIYQVGVGTLVANASVAFFLNLSVVFLIGRTSALALTLSGVLKDILLVCFSLLVFLDPVTLVQAFGYSVALCGLVYYKLGAEKIKQHLGDAHSSWTHFRVLNPMLTKLVYFGVVVIVLCVVKMTIAPSSLSANVQGLKNKFSYYQS